MKIAFKKLFFSIQTIDFVGLFLHLHIRCKQILFDGNMIETNSIISHDDAVGTVSGFFML